MGVPVVDGAGLGERLIPVAARAQGAQDREIGVLHDGQAQQADGDALEHAVGHHLVAQLAQGRPPAHGQRHQGRTIATPRIRVGPDEGAPDDPTALRPPRRRVPSTPGITMMGLRAASPDWAARL